MVDEHQKSYGLQRLDHAVGNAPLMMPVLQYIADATGFHQFAEFTADDVGTVDSGAVCIRSTTHPALQLCCLLVLCLYRMQCDEHQAVHQCKLHEALCCGCYYLQAPTTLCQPTLPAYLVDVMALRVQILYKGSVI